MGRSTATATQSRSAKPSTRSEYRTRPG
jgi:hypothetical protein